MSQPNNTYHPPIYNYSDNVQYFNTQSSHITNVSFPQWAHPRSRTLGNPAPSPSPSVQTSRTAPNLRDSRVTWATPMADPAAPNSSMLSPTSASRPRTAMDNLDPLARFYADAPWSSQNPRASSASHGRTYFSQPNMDYGLCREGPGSEISDSGYYTHHSLISNDPERTDQELPAEMTLQVSNLHVNSAPSEPVDVFRGMSADHTSQYSGRSANASKEFRCETCQEVSKCKSEHKKHMLRHNKPFKCNVTSCRRNGEGFTTENDLTRHKKSVHRIGMLQNSWQCASENCRNREKIWPRLDNFKQHIHRMHKDDDEQDLIQRSIYSHQEPGQTLSSLSGVPMDTTLAGIGTEKQFPGNELDDPVSGISLTPDQDTSNWTSTFDPNSHNFAMDVDQTNPTSYAQGSGRDSAFKFRAQSNAYEQRPGTVQQNDSNVERLNTLATIASTQSPEGATTPPPQLSNAPQTKADQQRQALQKFYKIIVQDIKNSSNGENLDIEDVVLRALTNAPKPTKKDKPSSPDAPTPSEDSDTLTKSEALKVSQAITALLKQSNKSPRSGPTKGFSRNTLTCERCGAVLARSCDMKKHMKRHTRPYGCTYPKCHKRFGAKSDWKRHENSQHFQLECFRCQILSPLLQTPCGELFHRQEMFTTHLQSQHHITDPDKLAQETRSRKIGKNRQGQFWCGFCEDIVKLTKKRNEAWDERFDHIDKHFCKDGKGIEEWLCVETRRKKGEVEQEVEGWTFEEEEDEDTHSGSPGTENGRIEDSSQPPFISLPSICTTPPENKSPRRSTSNSKKRQADPSIDVRAIPSSAGSQNLPQQKRARRETVRYCCSCQGGPWVQHLYADCMSCSHHICPRCPVARGPTGVDGLSGLT